MFRLLFFRCFLCFLFLIELCYAGIDLKKTLHIKYFYLHGKVRNVVEYVTVIAKPKNLDRYQGNSYYEVKFDEDGYVNYEEHLLGYNAKMDYKKRMQKSEKHKYIYDALHRLTHITKQIGKNMENIEKVTYRYFEDRPNYIESITTVGGEIEEKIVRETDNTGKILSEKVYASKELIPMFTVELDFSNNLDLIFEEVWHENETDFVRHRVKYDSLSNIISDMHYFENGEFEEIAYSYVYDNNMRYLNAESVYVKDENTEEDLDLSSSVVYFYERDSLKWAYLVSETHNDYLSEDSTTTKVIAYKNYVFDKVGNWTSRSVYIGTDLIATVRRKINYYK